MTTDCRHCNLAIPTGAKVCYSCKKSQGWLARKLEAVDGLARVVSISVSVFLVVAAFCQVWLALAQLDEATKQRESADRAFRVADDASTKAQDASTRADVASTRAAAAKGAAEQARDEARRTLESLRTMVKLQLDKDAAEPKLLLTGADTVKAGRASEELEKFAVPDENERKRWLESRKTK